MLHSTQDPQPVFHFLLGVGAEFVAAMGLSNANVEAPGRAHRRVHRGGPKRELGGQVDRPGCLSLRFFAVVGEKRASENKPPRVPVRFLILVPLLESPLGIMLQFTGTLQHN
eukprot:Lithocolla_globosa_v1_NODE_3752_length_1591_cov_6.196615.p3 type:complete len:112 gc:universal NODE_3752_length_1591_cov_6.196615:979-1314(+)